MSSWARSSQVGKGQVGIYRVKSGQVKSSWNGRGEIKSGLVKSSQDMPIYVRTARIKAGYIKSSQEGQIKLVQGKSSWDRSSQVRSDKDMLGEVR